MPASPAIDLVPNSQSVVQYDFYGNPRTGNHDAGAIEYREPTGTPSKHPASIAVFPNPAKDWLYISFPEKRFAKTAVIMDLNGRTLKAIPIYEGSISPVDVSMLPVGMYLISWKDESGAERIVKVMKW